MQRDLRITSLKYGLAKPDDKMYLKLNTEIIDILYMHISRYIAICI